MKVLSGVYPHGSYEGTIVFDGEERRFRDIDDFESARDHHHSPGAGADSADVDRGEHLPLASSRRGSASSTVTRCTGVPANCWRRSACSELPDTLITDLGVGKQQLVEIAKALSKRVRLLILDEPTASLNEATAPRCSIALVAFRQQGIASILISHKLNEVARSPTASRCCATAARSTTSIAGPSRWRKTASSAAWSTATLRTAFRSVRRGSAILFFEVKDWSVYHPLHAERQVDQECRPSSAARRGRGHRRPDGRRPHRIRDELVWPGLGPTDQRTDPPRRPRSRPLECSAARSMPALPM